jgi:3-oxoacyl-[acyl-carrier-protein] synthase II
LNKRVVVTGMAGISPLGSTWAAVSAKLRSLTNGVMAMKDWEQYEGLNTKLGAPAVGFDLPEARYNRKALRTMGRVAVLAVRTSEMALEDAGLLGHPVVSSGDTGVAYGSSAGNPEAIADFASLASNKSISGINATTYIRMMGHTAAVNIGLFFKTKGRIIPTSSACTSGSQGIGYAFEAIQSGRQRLMIAGGCEELHAADAAVFDTLFATSTTNDHPELSPRPYDRSRDGLVIGEGAGTLILEELDHALARGARIHAELLSFATNSDGWHVTQPNAETMQEALRSALAQAQLRPEDIGYINGHGTATEHGDVAECQATSAVFKTGVPFSSLKSYMGHTLGACGALEAWISIGFMNEGWAAPNLNLKDLDPRCEGLNFIRDGVQKISAGHIMSNNFAFGGINTSLIFKKWKP